jgi:RNA polymerase sigma-70 factor, ECF subfamily
MGDTSVDIDGQHLLAQCRKAKDISPILSHYGEGILRFLRSFLKNDDDADDVYQEVSLKLWTKIHVLEAPQNLESVLFAIARNAAIDFVRKTHQKPKNLEKMLKVLSSSAVPDPSALAEERELNRLVKKAVDDLPDNLQTPIVEHYYKGISIPEIAEICCAPISTIEYRIKTARLMLSKSLAKVGKDLYEP